VSRDHNDVRLKTSSGSYEILMDEAGKRLSVEMTGKQAVVTAEATGYVVTDQAGAMVLLAPGSGQNAGSVREIRILSYEPPPGAKGPRFVANAPSSAPNNLLPSGVPAVKAPQKTAFALRYQDIAIGTGAEAQPNKMYKVNYTGYLGANGRDDDGRKFDSSYDHRAPVLGKDGKPVMGDDGKPKLGDPQPFSFPQGYGRLIPGWDQGFEGMKIGGKRRLFVPWQLAYGARGRPGPDAEHPGIPPKADLIFDVELVDVTDMPMPPNRPGMPPGGRPAPGAGAPAPGTGGAPGQPGARPLGQIIGKPAPPAQPAAPAAPGAAPTTTPAPAPAPGTAPKPATPGAPAQPVTPTAPASPSAPPAPATTPTPATAPGTAAPTTPPSN
jgi:peptidylprolyl isomerase